MIMILADFICIFSTFCSVLVNSTKNVLLGGSRLVQWSSITLIPNKKYEKENAPFYAL